MAINVDNAIPNSCVMNFGMKEYEYEGEAVIIKTGAVLVLNPFPDPKLFDENNSDPVDLGECEITFYQNAGGTVNTFKGVATVTFTPE